MAYLFRQIMLCQGFFTSRLLGENQQSLMVPMNKHFEATILVIIAVSTLIALPLSQFMAAKNRHGAPDCCDRRSFGTIRMVMDSNDIPHVSTTA
jgi:hypothetical protein